MLVDIPEKEEKFEPIKLNITLTTLEEAKQFYALFNVTGVTDGVPDIDHDSIRSGINQQNSRIRYEHNDQFAHLSQQLKEKYGCK